MNTIHKVGANTLWQIGSKIVNALTGLVIIGSIQRLLGETAVGTYTIIISYVSFFFMPVDFGLNAIVVKELIEKKENKEKTFQNILAFRIILSLLLMITAIVIAYALPYNKETGTGFSPQINTGIIAAVFAIFAQALVATANGFFQANQDYKHSFIANAVAAATNVILFLVLIAGNAQVHIAIASLSISGIAGGCTALYFAKKKLKDITPRIHKQYLKEILAESAPLTISLILNLVYFRIDSLILPFYRSVEEVGRYNIAYKMFDTLLVIPNYFSNALFPNLIEKLKTGRGQFTTILKKAILLLGATGIASSVLSYVLAPVGVQIITGSSSSETVEYVRILTSGLVFFFLSSIMMWGLIAIKKQKYLAYIYGTTMCINIILNYTLIPYYGAKASAIITITTELLVLIASSAIVCKELLKKNYD